MLLGYDIINEIIKLKVINTKRFEGPCTKHGIETSNNSFESQELVARVNITRILFIFLLKGVALIITIDNPYNVSKAFFISI